MGKKALLALATVLAAVSLSPQAYGQVTYRFGAGSELLDAAFYAGQAEDGSNAAGRMAFMGRASNDTKRVAFWGVNAATYQSAFFVVDVGDPSSWRRITADIDDSPSSPIYWTPDNSALLVGGHRIVIPPPGQLTQAVPHYVQGIRTDDASVTALPDNNWIHCLLSSSNEIVALPVLGDGTEDLSRQPVVITDFVDGTVDPDWPSVSPDGTMVTFADYHGVGQLGVQADVSDVHVIKNVPAILAASPKPGTNISSLAPVDLSDANVVQILSSESINFAHTPFFSQDKSLVLFSEDFNNVFADRYFFETLFAADFDAMVSNSDGSGIDYQLQEAGNQALPAPTHGGIRIVYIRDEGGVLHLLMSTLEVATAVSGDALPGNNLQTTAPQEARDGSGTVVSIPSATVIDFPDGATQEIQVETPVDPVSEPQLPPGIDAIPVLRDFGPDGTTFSPPITVTISYTDAEVEGLDETVLRVYRYNPVSGVYDDEITTGVVRDPANNRVSFSVDHFSTFGLGAPGDADDDGIPDIDDPDDDNDGLIDAADNRPLDTDNDGIDNDADGDDDSDGISDLDDTLPYDSDNDGQRNDADADDDNDGLSDVLETGTYFTNPYAADSDGDGATDADEVQAGSDPNNPAELPSLPLAIAAALALAAALAALGARRL